MEISKSAEVRRVAAELYGLREAAAAIEEPFLAYLIGMAVIEGEKLSEEPIDERPEKAEAPQLVETCLYVPPDLQRNGK